VVLDPTLLGPAVVQGVKPDTKLVVNTSQTPDELKKSLGLDGIEAWVIDATSLALKVIGRPITNTAMLGSFVKATSMVQLDSLLEVVKERFSGRIQETNVEVVKTAYKEVVKG
jgi:pyruvate ferredoxin oxidoreductase gamma subunit